MCQPNILLFTPDQLRGDWAGPHKAGRVRTPALDRLAAPSRACPASGYKYDCAGVRSNSYGTSPDAIRRAARRLSA